MVKNNKYILSIDQGTTSSRGVIFDENYETGGLYAENEVAGTGKSGTFVTPGQPLTIFGGLHLRW